MKPENFADPLTPAICPISIIIKLLRKEKRIAVGIESALHAICTVGGKVVLGSLHLTDRTVKMAQGFPIRIVHLAHPQDRHCGAGSQLGFRHSHDEFVYLLDGDMKMLERFLPQSPDFLRSYPGMAWLAALFLAPAELLIIYKRSLTKGSYFLASWCFSRAGLLRGLLLARHRAGELISSRVLREPTGCSPVSTQNSRS